MSTDKIDNEPVADALSAEEQELEQACLDLQKQINMAMEQQEGQDAEGSIDEAITSLKENEHNNVSTVQLVALVA